MDPILRELVLGKLGKRKVIVTPAAVKREQFRFPRSKRKRIRKKWARCAKNYRSVPLGCFMLHAATNTLLAHPADWALLEREARRLRAEDMTNGWQQRESEQVSCSRAP